MFTPAELSTDSPEADLVEQHHTVAFGYGMADFDDPDHLLWDVELDEDDYR
ncbi:hypothetical protein Lfu02_43090 [Longispora fulva]|uniref:Uncharacterized protein n=1 Tax=Longispora fulva TaxID=619741 RepID=A0A8J7GFF1_9ACTN|nr:hypothetical protein [Longispora fulva]MBG6136766.1 hypothetical protein [Longispora fulva]GIG59937.1 hypothetical protein Lfu02_43090 [Longispora fulva]